MSAASHTIVSDAGIADALDGCEHEPIRTPGAIQPRGSLLVTDTLELRLRYASENASLQLGRPVADALGRTLDELGLGALAAAASELVSSTRARPIRLALSAGDALASADVFAHRAGEHIVIELEDVERGGETTEFARFQDDVLDTLDRLQSAGDVATVLERAVEAVRDLTGFERVLAYRFEPDEHGIVVAERHAPGLEPFLGLHFPASDIPAQARALYREQWLRAIPDSAAGAIDLLGSPGGPPPSSVDLSAAVLRAVSPVHLQYLRNMGVRASMSVSLIVRGRLWGLIVCHGYREAHAVPYRVRAACEVVGRTASMTLEPKEDLAEAERRSALERVSVRLLEEVGHSATIAEGLLRTPARLLELARASGAAIRIGGTLHTVGETPPRPALDLVLEVARTRLGEDGRWFASDCLPSEHPELAGVEDRACGVLAASLSPRAADLVVWLRPELVQTVEWAGDPRAPMTPSAASDDRIGPRRSFDAWAETVRGRSLEWDPAELDAVELLRGTLAIVHERRTLFARERHVNDVIRASMQPSPLPDPPGLDVAAVYRPSGEGFGVSGDFYDMVAAGDEWLVVIGDVCGKGPHAARLTALARHTVRAVALHDPSITPARMLAVLNDAFLVQADRLFATIQIARIGHTTSEGASVRLSSGGHPPALHRHLGTIAPRTSGNALIGARAGLPYRDVEFVLAPGDSLTFFTDGVSEAGRPGPIFGEERLAQVIGSAGDAGASHIVEAIDEAIRELQPGELRDDVALISVRVPPRPAAARAAPEDRGARPAR